MTAKVEKCHFGLFFPSTAWTTLDGHDSPFQTDQHHIPGFFTLNKPLQHLPPMQVSRDFYMANYWTINDYLSNAN